MPTIDIDLWRGYQPLPAQRAFHQGQEQHRLYAGAFRAGKTMAACREAFRIVVQNPGSVGLISRLRWLSLFDTTFQTFKRELAITGLNQLCRLKEGQHPEAIFWNGSRILFRNLDNEMNLHGLELDWYYVDEGSEVPTSTYKILNARLSGTPHPEGQILTKKPDPNDPTREINVRVAGPLKSWVSTNPGPSDYLRDNFIDQQKPGFAAYAAKTSENPYLPPGYLQGLLDNNTHEWVQAYVNGSWDAFEGQRFKNFSKDTHVLTGPWTPWHEPGHTRYEFVEGLDFGWVNPTVCVWLAWDPTGEQPTILFDEYQRTETDPPAHAQAIWETRRKWGLDTGRLRSIGDPAGAQRTSANGGMSDLHQYATQGIHIGRASGRYRDPGPRANRIGSHLHHTVSTPDGPKPRLLILETCTNTIRSITSYRRKDGTGIEDGPEQFVKKDDHHVDALGYALSAIPVHQWAREAADGRLETTRPHNHHTYHEPEPDTGQTLNAYGITI